MNTCHDCGYKQLYQTKKDGGQIHMCSPKGFYFTDVPDGVKKNCRHWVPFGSEDKNVEYNAFNTAKDYENDEEECQQTSLGVWC